MNTRKVQSFMSEPMGIKPLTAVGGIGPISAPGFNSFDMTMATTQTTTKAFTFTNNPMGNNPLSEAGGIGRKYNDKGFSFGAVDNTTTKKARLFMNEPMGNKPLTEVGGIGPYYARSLTNQGFTNAAQLCVHFLDMKREKEQFKNWFFQVTGAEAKWQDQCYDSLNGYYQNFHQ